MLRKLLLATLAVGGLMVAATPAQATDYNQVRRGDYATHEECIAAGEAGLLAGWEDYRCTNTNTLWEIVYLH